MRYILRDDSAPHQIRLTFVGSRMAVGVSCTCLMRPLARTGPNVAYKTIKILKTGQDPWPFYDDPGNHNNEVEQFEPAEHGSKACRDRLAEAGSEPETTR